MMSVAALSKILKYSFIATIAVMLASTFIWAQDDIDVQPPQPEAEMMQELQEMHERTQEIGKRLSDLQEKALEEKPELVRQRRALEKLVEKGIEAQGIDLDESIQELQDMQSKLQEEDMADDEREAMTMELQQKAQNLDMVYSEVMQSEQVQRAQKAFETKLIEAMTEFDDQVEELIEELQEKQEKMQNMIMQIQSQRMQQQLQNHEPDDNAME